MSQYLIFLATFSEKAKWQPGDNLKRNHFNPTLQHAGKNNAIQDTDNL
jgi:hypothetical protein